MIGKYRLRDAGSLSPC